MKIYFLAAITLFLVACGAEENPSSFLPEANGQHGEILILMDDNLWDGQVGRTVVEKLNQQAKGVYLRPEPMFTYFRKKPDDLNHLNQLNRNILKFMVDFDSTYAETAVHEQNDYFAKNQLFIIVKDSDPERLLAYAQNEFNECLDLFNDFETKQLTRQYKSDPNKNVKELAEKKFGITISLPDNSELATEKENFVLVKRDRSKNLMPNDATSAQGGTFWIQQGFLFWTEPFVDSMQMTKDYLLQMRDSTLKHNVPGRVKGTYMSTEYEEYYAPIVSNRTINGMDAVEIRGLWKNVGNAIIDGGGPFVQVTVHNKEKNLLITVCGYIYAPKFDKREYIREIDAVLNTIELAP